MAEPKLKKETRIKVCLLLKLLKNESLNSIANLTNQSVKEEATLPLNSVEKKTELHKNIAKRLNQYVKDEEVTQLRVAKIHQQLESGNKTPYIKDEWQLCISKSVFKCIVEEDKPVQEKLLDLATRSEINIK